MSIPFTVYDASGNPVEIVESRPVSSWGDSSGGGRSLGRATLQTTDGRFVEFVSDGVFNIVDDNNNRIRLTREKPST